MRPLKLMSFLIIFAAIFFAGCSAGGGIQVVTSNPKSLPKFNFTTLADQPYTNDNLPEGKNIVMIYLDPDCIFCQTAIQRFKRNMSTFEDVQFLIVSVHSEKDLRQFAELHEIEKQPQMLIVRDRNNFMAKNFIIKGYPALYLFDEKGKFLKDFQGLTNIDEVEAALKAPQVSN